MLIKGLSIKNLPNSIKENVTDYLDLESFENLKIVEKTLNKPFLSFQNENEFIKFCNIQIANKTTINLKRILSTEEGKEYVLNKLLDKKTKQNMWLLALKLSDWDLMTILNTIPIDFNFTHNEYLDILMITSENFDFEYFSFFLNHKCLNENESVKVLESALGVTSLIMPETDIEIAEQLKIIKLLLKRNNNLIKELATHFYIVIYTLNLPLVKYLINTLKIDINIKNKGTPIFFRVIYHFRRNCIVNVNEAIKMFKYLLQSGANVFEVDFNGLDIYATIKLVIKSIKIQNRFFSVLKGDVL